MGSTPVGRVDVESVVDAVTPSPTEKSLSPAGGGNLFTPAPVATPSIQTPSPGHHNGI
jgi:hypothetical protein